MSSLWGGLKKVANCGHSVSDGRSMPLTVDFCVQLVYKKAVLKGLKMGISNAESTTDS